LTLNQAHTSLFGAFGLLAIGLIYFCLRYAAGGQTRFSDEPGLIAFWLYNAGLVLWIALNCFPIGWPQLEAVYQHGLAYARSRNFTIRPCCGSGCVLSAMFGSQLPRCCWRSISSSSSDDVPSA
jgi:nitric oxide reductase large subunit